MRAASFKGLLGGGPASRRRGRGALPARACAPPAESAASVMRVPLKSLRIGIVCGTLLLATRCRAVTEPQPSPRRYVRFIESLVAPRGLVQSRPRDNFTTAWKNALAAMVFLHEGNVLAARG